MTPTNRKPYAMRYLYLLLCLLMLLFIAVQYNDPDGPAWMAFYLLPAVWTAIAAGRPGWLQHRAARSLLLGSLALSCILTVWFWPTTPHWWLEEVWYETETAREGMGVMIATVILLLVTLLSGRQRITASAGQAAAASPATPTAQAATRRFGD